MREQDKRNTAGDETRTHRAEPSRGPSASVEAAARSAASGRLNPGMVAALQRVIGNSALAAILQRDARAYGPGHTEPVQRSAVHDVLRSPGRPLDETVRADMEARLGADFSDVRIHTDEAAKASAAEVGARAYTSGSHVVIGEGGADAHTLAHELTHVIQQRQGPVAGTDNGSGLKVSDPSDRFEREAEANARHAMTGAAPAPQGAQAVRAGAVSQIQRMEEPAPQANLALSRGVW